MKVVLAALGTLTAAGTGNISAISETARGIQSLQMVLDLVIIGFVAALILARYSNLLSRPQPELSWFGAKIPGPGSPETPPPKRRSSETG